MTREKRNNIVINVNSEAVQNKSWGINSQTVRSNPTALPKIIFRVLYLHKIENINSIFRGLIKMLFYNIDRHTYFRKSQAPYGINLITNFIKLPALHERYLSNKNPHIHVDFTTFPFLTQQRQQTINKRS